MLSHLLQGLCPYPTVSRDGALRAGLMIGHPPSCARPHKHACSTFAAGSPGDGVWHFTCPKKWSVLVFRWGQTELVVNGIFVPEKNSSLSVDLRKEHRSNRVRWADALEWNRGVASQALALLEQAVSDKSREAVEGLHDVKTAVSLVVRNAEAILPQYPGRNSDEQIESAPDDMKSLLKSVQLLNSVLQMSSILANPESAAFGRRHPLPVYRVFHRMVRLFEQLAAKKGIEVGIRGTSYSTPRCYDSFEVIALVLIENAIKYSRSRGRVLVWVDDIDGGVRVAIESNGPLIPDEMRETVFQRGVRCESGVKHSAKGSGLGLYIAAIVARAHGFRISYRKELESQGPPGEGRNVFEFEVLEPDLGA